MFSLLKKTYFCTVTSGLQISMKVKIQEQEPFNEQHVETRAFNQLSYFIFVWLCWRSLQWACIFVGLRKWPLIFAALKEARNAEMLLLPKGGREKSRTRGWVMKMGRQQLLRTLALSSLFNIVINHQTLFILCIFQHFQPCEIQNLKLFPNFVR